MTCETGAQHSANKKYYELEERKPNKMQQLDVYCSTEDGHNDARNMLRQKLIINI